MLSPILENAASNKAFSRIYVEEAALTHERTREILSHFPQVTPVICRDYKDIFCRTHQEPALQKHAPALILARSKTAELHPGAPVCQSFSEEYFYYTSGVMNCIYDCEYCYLQGMYPSAHLVVFVNLEETFSALTALLQKHSVYLCISYDTDLLAIEPFTGLLRDWYAFAKENPALTLELRTKCASKRTLASLPVLSNVILAITISPEEIIRQYEHRTPSAEMRIAFAEYALSLGHPLRLCFDPMIYVPAYQKLYRELFQAVFSRIPGSAVRDVSLGVFRISKDYLKTMRKNRPCAITYYPYTLEQGVYHYGKERTGKMLAFARQELLSHISESQLFVWEERSDL